MSMAIERFKSILREEGNPESWLRIVAAPDTAEGVSYLLDMGDEEEGNPIIRFTADNVHVVVDRVSNLELTGAHIEPAVTIVLELLQP